VSQVEGVTVEDDLEGVIRERQEAQAAAAAEAAAREAAERKAAAQRARDAQEPPALAALRGIVDK
jgi:ribosomal protein L12E/L44/L45/RPP1/RPP2